MEAWQLEARESIRDLVARYNANGDAGRFDPMLELFAEAAVLEVPDGRYQGRAAIRAFVEEVARGADRPPVRLLRHHTATLQIDVESRDSARSRCYYQVFTERGVDHWGRYVDAYCRVDGRWLFLHRKVTLDGSVPGAWTRASAPGTGG